MFISFMPQSLDFDSYGVPIIEPCLVYQCKSVNTRSGVNAVRHPPQQCCVGAVQFVQIDFRGVRCDSQPEQSHERPER